MKKLVLLPTLLFLLFSPLLGQNITIAHGEENTIDAKNSSFSVLTQAGDYLIVFEANSDERNVQKYFLHNYNINKNYKLKKRFAIDLGENDLGGGLELEFLDTIKGKIYIIVTSVNQAHTKKEYFSLILNLDLSVHSDWESFITVTASAENRTLSFGGFYNVHYMHGEEVFSILDRDMDDNKFKEGEITYYKSRYYDLEFDEIEFIEKESNKSNKFYSYFELFEDNLKSKEYPYTDRVTREELGDTIIFVVLNNDKKRKDYFSEEEKGKRYAVFFVKKSKDDLKKAKDKGLICEVPEGYRLTDINTAYDKTANIITIYGNYVDDNASKKEKDGIFFIRYNLTAKKVLVEKYNTVSAEYAKSVINDPLGKSFSGYYEDGITFYEANGSYYIALNVIGNINSSSYSTSRGGGIIVDSKNVFSNISILNFTTNGEIKNYHIVKKEFDVSTIIPAMFNKSFPDPLVSSGGTPVFIFHDNTKNYTDGSHNGKNKATKTSNACMAYVTVENGELVRKQIVQDIEQQLGAFPMGKAVYRVNNKEYAWLCFSEGKTKFVIFTLD